MFSRRDSKKLWSSNCKAYAERGEIDILKAKNSASSLGFVRICYGAKLERACVPQWSLAFVTMYRDSYMPMDSFLSLKRWNLVAICTLAGETKTTSLLSQWE